MRLRRTALPVAKNFDTRYRKKYGMSMLDNLKYNEEYGIEKFIEQQNAKYVSKKAYSLSMTENGTDNRLKIYG